MKGEEGVGAMVPSLTPVAMPTIEREMERRGRRGMDVDWS